MSYAARFPSAIAGVLSTLVLSACSGDGNTSPGKPSDPAVTVSESDYCTPDWWLTKSNAFYQQPSSQGSDGHVPHFDQLIIKVKPGGAGHRDGDAQSRVEAALARALNKISSQADDPTALRNAVQTGMVHYHRPMSGGAAVIKLSTEFPAFETSRLIDALNSDPEVDYAEPDYPQQGMTLDTDALPKSVAPADDNQLTWHLQTINADAALKLLPKADTLNAAVVAVLDGGFAKHPALVEDRVEYGRSFAPSLNPSCARLAEIDFEKRPDCLVAQQPSDTAIKKDVFSFWLTRKMLGISQRNLVTSGLHGLQVAGFIAARKSLQPGAPGVNGVNPHASLLYARVGSATTRLHTSDVVDAMRWSVGLATSTNGQALAAPSRPARIMNISLGDSLRAPFPCPHAYRDAIQDVRAKNASIVVAAGNQASPASWSSPGNCPGVINVGASDMDGKRYASRIPDGLLYAGKVDGGSNYGKAVTISAPGKDVAALSLTSEEQEDARVIPDSYSSLKYPRTLTSTPSIEVITGTSFSAPQVAGVITLMLAANDGLTPDNIETILVSTAQKPKTPMDECTAPPGAGIVNAEAAVKMALAWKAQGG